MFFNLKKINAGTFVSSTLKVEEIKSVLRILILPLQSGYLATLIIFGKLE